MGIRRSLTAAATSVATVAAVSVVGVVVTATPASAAQYQEIAEIPVGSYAFAVALNRSGTKAYIARYNNTVNAVSVFNTQTNTWDDTVSSVTYPFAVAVRGDDTIYASQNISGSVAVIAAGSLTKSNLATGDPNPTGIAIDYGNVADPLDDSIYVADDPNSRVSVIGGATGTVDDTFTLAGGSEPLGVAVDQNDDTVYTANQIGDNIASINPRTRAVQYTATADGPWGIVTHPADDTVYVSTGAGSVQVINGRTRTLDDTITVGSGLTGIAINGSGTRVFATAPADDSLVIIDTTTRSVIGTVSVGDNPNGVAVRSVGGHDTIYVANTGSGTLSVITLNYAVNFDPNGGTGSMAAQYDDTATALTANAFVRSGYNFTGWNTAANGTGTPYANGAISPFNADDTLYAQWQLIPPPPTPAGPPLNPTAEPGYESATVTWEAPASSGSYPVSQYRVTSSPDGKTCLVAAPGGQGGAGGAGGAGSAAAQPRVSEPSSTYGEIKNITSVRSPVGVGVKHADDTVYVTSSLGAGVPGSLVVVNGRTGAVTPGAYTVGAAPFAVGVNQSNDELYVANTGSGTVSVINGRIPGPGGVQATINVGNSPRSLAVDQQNGTIYATSYGTGVTAGTTSVIDAPTNTVVKNIATGRGPVSTLLRESTNTLFIGNQASEDVWAINAETGSRIGQPIDVETRPSGLALRGDSLYVALPNANTIARVDLATNSVKGYTRVGNTPLNLAMDQSEATLFVTNSQSGSVSVIDARTNLLTHTVRTGSFPNGIAIDEAGTNRGLVYVANHSSSSVSVIAKASPRLLTTAGPEGTTVKLTLDVPNLAPEFVMGSNALRYVFFDGRGVGLATKGADNTWTVRAPAGLTGTVPVTVELMGGNRASAGSFTYQAAPQPISCKVPGLTPGVEYTFTVEALTGAGWGTPSVPSNIAIPFGPAASKFTTPGIYQCTVVGGTGSASVRIPFTVKGGQGGTGNQGFRFGTPNPGGFGASVAGSFSVLSGSTLYLTVGSNGLDAPVFDDSRSAAGGGGGYSAISLGLTSDPVVVAGGGGGGANYDSAPTSPGVGKGGNADPTSAKSGGGDGGNIHGVGEAGGTLATGGRGGDRGNNGGNGGVSGVPGQDASPTRRASGGGGGGGFGASGGEGRDPVVRVTSWTTRPTAFGAGGGAGLDGGGGGGGYAGGGGGAGIVDAQSAGGGGGGASLLVSASTAAGITGKIDGALASNSTAPSVEVGNLKCGFAVTYEGSGNTAGTVPRDPDFYASGASATVADGGSLTRGSQVFVGWATSQFGPVAYVPGSRIDPINAPVTLWAVYGTPKTVTFDANQGSGTMAPQSSGSAEPLESNAFTRVDYAFTGWNTNADGTGIAYANGATYGFSSDATLYAQWVSAPTPKPEPIPEPLDPGEHYYEEDTTPKPVDVAPNPFNDGIAVVGTTWTMTLEGLNGDGNPLPLNEDGVLVLQAERDARTTGSEFLPNSLVGLFLDPQVETAVTARTLPTVDLGTVSVDGNGNFSGIKTLPEEIKPGMHVLQAVGYGPAGDRRALSIGILVVPWLELNQGTRKPAGRHDRMNTTGTSGGIDAGSKLTPWIKYNGQGAFKGGVANIRVRADGSFTWTRLIKKSKGLTGYVSWNDIKSNEVFWPKIR